MVEKKARKGVLSELWDDGMTQLRRARKLTMKKRRAEKRMNAKCEEGGRGRDWGEITRESGTDGSARGKKVLRPR